MPDGTTKAWTQRSVRYWIRVNADQDRKLTALARTLGYDNASSYLRALADKAPSIPQLVAPEALPDRAATQAVDTRTTELASIQQAINNLSTVAHAAFRHSTSASYVAMHVWRLLADKAKLPPRGLPQDMRDDIEELQKRAIKASKDLLGNGYEH